MLRTLVLISCVFYAAYSIKCNQYLKGTVNGNEVALSGATEECNCKFCLLMSGINKNNHGQVAGCGCADEANSAVLKQLGYDQRTARMMVEAMTCRQTGSTNYVANGATSTFTCCNTAACN